MCDGDSVSLPNPWKDTSNFGRRMSRWARPEAGGRASMKSDGSTSNNITFASDSILEVSLGIWNNLGPIEHTEMILRLDKPKVEVGKEGILGRRKKSYSERLSMLKKPLWVVNAYMGGELLVLIDETKNLANNPKANAPLALGEDVSRRPWSVDGTVVRKHWVEVYHMKASTFVTLLRRFIRWGFAVGANREFRFHPFVFLFDDLQSMNNDDKTLNFINCQASAAMFVAWWLVEVKETIDNNINKRQSRLELATVDTAILKIAPHILMEPYKVCCLWWTTSVREEAKEKVEQFLKSSAVKHAMDLTDEQATSIIENYEKQKSEKKCSDKELQEVTPEKPI